MAFFRISCIASCLGWLFGSGLLQPVCLTAGESDCRIPALATSNLPDIEKGLILFEELNCAACHAGDARVSDRSKRAPRLANIAERRNPYYVKRFVGDPQRVKPGTSMPNVMANFSDEEREQRSEAIVQFLLSQGDPSKFHLQPIDRVAAEAGEVLFNSVGCAICHSPRDAAGNEILQSNSVSLGKLDEKYSLPSLIEFIKRPHQTRPSGRMPNLQLTQTEVEKIANFLLQDTRLPGHLAYTMYRGRVWEGLEVNVDKVKAGAVDSFDLSNFEKVENNSAYVFEGLLNVAQAGKYKFVIESNGGELIVNESSVVDLPASNRRGVKTVEGEIELEAGWVPIQFTYYHTGKEPSLSLAMQGPGFPLQPIPSNMLSISEVPIDEFQPYSMAPSLVAAGQRYFTELGCINCHDDVRPPSAPPRHDLAPAWNQLKPDRGCLSAELGNWPQFSFSSLERGWLQAVLPKIDGLQLSDQQVVNKTLVANNCVACHQRGQLGGVAPERNHLFIGSRPELGNDGRLPPPLDGVGAKLSPTWLSEVVLRGGQQRHYLATKMPVFGEANVGHLPQLLLAVDQVEPVEFEAIAEKEKAAVKAVGRLLVGSQGFSCIACHDFNGQRATGPGAFDIIHSTERLQKDWFYRFMLDPGRYRKGTIMPAAWPGGHAFKEDLLGGDAKRQIESIWFYLEDGTRAKNPVGLSRQSPEIRVTDVAEVCRGRGVAGYRGIAVGYPAGINLAYDSEQMNLRMLWKDAFVTVDHGSFQPRGRERIEFPDGVPFFPLQSLEDNWPYKRKTDYLFPQDIGYRFQGYFLDEQRRPTFMFRYGDISINETFQDMRNAEGQAYFLRRFTFENPNESQEFYFRAASGTAMSDLGEQRRTFVVDGLNVTITSEQAAVIRRGEPEELLIPLKVPQGKSTLELEYKW